MEILISNSSDKPIYEQICLQIKSQIMNGSLAPGEEPNSGICIPARWASTATASLKGRFSSSIT